MQSDLFHNSEVIERGADISDDGLYRYRLWRTWDKKLPVMVWVMLNPSKADAKKDDATITRCIGFAKQWGYGGIDVINLFALRSTDPKALVESLDPVGPDNWGVFQSAVLDSNAKLIVAAWGGSWPPGTDTHIATVRSLLERHGAQCLGHTQKGEPKHPVRLAYATKLREL